MLLPLGRSYGSAASRSDTSHVTSVSLPYHFSEENFIKSSSVFFVLLLVGLSGCSKSEESAGKQLFAAPSLPEEEMLDEAMHAYDSGLFSVAKTSWISLKDGYPASYFLPLAELKAADSFFQVSDFIAAQTGYEEFARLHPGHEAMAYVRFQLGNCAMQQYQGEKYDQSPLTTAIKLFQQLIDDYPSSEYTVLARRKISDARELLAMHESYVAGFYLNQGRVEASAARLTRLSADFPESAAAKNARQLLVTEYPAEMDALDARVAADSGAEIARIPKKEPRAPRIIERRELADNQRAIDSASLTPSIRESELADTASSNQGGFDTFTVSLARAFRPTGTEQRTPTTLTTSYVVIDEAAGITVLSRNISSAKEKDFSCELNSNRTLVRETVSTTGVTNIELSLSHQSNVQPVLFVLDRPDRILVVLRPAADKSDQG
jgi:outer membrane protein assembly factor BamD